MTIKQALLGDVEICRAGHGSGHGWSAMPGEAHESAIKEAETDATKRSLATFGNPLGHPRFVFPFVPTSCSWLNAVEGFFTKLSKRRLKRGVFRSIADLQAAINHFLDEINEHPKPLIWTADPDKIIAAVKRGHQVLDSIH